MEMYVSVNFKFEDDNKQKTATQAFDLLNMNSKNDHSHIDSKLGEFKRLMSETFDDMSLFSVVEEHGYIDGIEDLKINKAGSTSFSLVTGSSGDEFADDLQRFLKSLGTKKLKIKIECDEDEY